jgi:hypothetical protein
MVSDLLCLETGIDKVSKKPERTIKMESDEKLDVAGVF